MKTTTKNLSILLLLSTTTTLAQDTSTTGGDYPCFSLQNSSTCSAFSNFYISLVGNLKRYPFLANVTDVNSFDVQLLNFVNSDAFYLQQLGCSSASQQQYSTTFARYSLTYMCESLIQDSSYSLPCNFQNGLNPPPLCQSTCFEWTSSIYNNTNNNLKLCPNQIQTLDQVNNLNTTCQIWSGLNATSNCIAGIVNEPNYCGFNSTSDACSYCKSNSGDNCCQLVSGCSKSLSTGAIIGIVIGVLIFVGIIGAFLFWFCFSKKSSNRSRKGVSFINGNGGNGYVLKQKVEHNDSSSQLVHGGGEYESLKANQQRISNQPPITTSSRFTDANISMEEHTTPLIVNTQSQPPTQTLEEFYQVKHPYPPQMGDELGLHVGDIVCVAMNFDDGWALGFNVTTGLKGVFPVVCVTPVPDELLEQLLYVVNNEGEQPQVVEEQATNKTLVEDNLSMHQIVENLRRSISLSSNSKRSTIVINSLPVSELTNHNNIPRRTASMMRRNSIYDYKESDSPTSPTHNTPFFPLNQPEPALFHQHLHNNPASINSSSSSNSTPLQQATSPKPKIETIEMYRKNNRVSKLEEED